MKKFVFAPLFLGAFVPVSAGANSLVAPGPQTSIAKSSIAATPAGEWNRLSRTEGKGIEVWTRDGDQLNRISFFGGIPAGQSLYKERDKKNYPLPKIAGNMLLPDIPVLFESTYRSQYKVNKMSIENQEFAVVGGKEAIRFNYSYVRNEDEVQRSGEAVGTIVNKKLYLVTYEAPSIYFFEKDHAAFKQIVETLKF